MPDGITLEQAAAAPTSGMTALQGLHRAKLRAGQRVLVIGAGGGVGTFAVQIAKALGAEVTGVCSTAKVGLVRGIGADHVTDYTREDFARDGQRYDVIFDIAGSRPLAQLRRSLTPDGTLVVAGGEDGGRWLGELRRSIRGALTSPFVRHRVVAQAWEVWRAEVAFADRFVAEAPSLDLTGAQPDPHRGPLSLRWVLVHMEEEYARHNGHADLLRERIDGAVGQ